MVVCSCLLLLCGIVCLCACIVSGKADERIESEEFKEWIDKHNK